MLTRAANRLVPRARHPAEPLLKGRCRETPGRSRPPAAALLGSGLCAEWHASAKGRVPGTPMLPEPAWRASQAVAVLLACVRGSRGLNGPCLLLPASRKYRPVVARPPYLVAGSGTEAMTLTHTRKRYCRPCGGQKVFWCSANSARALLDGCVTVFEFLRTHDACAPFAHCLSVCCTVLDVKRH
jgi:hypothetical protein